ncbi:MAG: enoyl-CoA hydratase-related protein [Aeromicrobium sp.]
MTRDGRQAVSSSVDGGVLVLTVDNPPVNAGSTAVRQGLLDGVSRLRDDASLVGAVVVGAGGSFIAGSDLREFGGRLPEPLLPAVITAIEQCGKPVIAALDGHALGGGFEVALGCHGRIGTSRLRVALPEVSLGMVTGAGASQRLPRLVGRETALDLILSGRRVGGAEAADLGILDQVAEPDELLSAAVEMARHATPRILMDEPLPDPAPSLDAIAEPYLASIGARPQLVESLRLVRAAGSRPPEQMLADERSMFDTLRLGEEAAALRHLFFAGRAARKDPLSDRVRAEIVDQLTCAGGAVAPDVGADPASAAPMLTAMAAETAELLRTGIVARPGDIDLLMVDDGGFPRHLGGPLWWATRVGDVSLERSIPPTSVDAVNAVWERVRTDG